MWIFFGIVHLLLYRAVNYYWAVDSASVESFGTFLYYVVTNYALYLKVSGLFHMILGCLFMFGFALPETHGRYYLSNSFIELWRRVNIYWKDFMQKLVFNPAYMALKKRGSSHRSAVISSIALVFIVTWWTHAYQWFWLVGSWLLTVPDTVFWILLGGLLIVQTIGNERPDRPEARALIGPQTLLVIQTFSMMTTLMILWSLWSCQTLGEWFAIVERGGVKILGPVETWTFGGIAQSIVILGFFFVIGTFSVGYTLGLAPKGSHPKASALGKKDPFHFGRNALQTSAVLAAVLIVQAPSVYSLLPVSVQSTVVDMGVQRLSDREQAVLERGYYESLTGAGSAAGLMNAGKGAPADWDVIREMNAVEMTGDFMEYVLKPSMVVFYKEAMLSTNSHGMRDKEYALEKPQGTTRIALLGASRAMGAGVADDETFEGLLETNLTDRLGRPIEILNFGVSDYEPARRALSLTQKAAAFSPDIVLYVAHANDFQVRHLALRYTSGTPRPYPFEVLEQALDAADVTTSMSYGEVRERLKPYGKQIVRDLYAEMAEDARDLGAKPVWVYVPSIKRYEGPKTDAAELRDIAREAGFLTISLEELFKGQDIERLWLREWDQHPNALGHRLIADRLEEVLTDPDVARQIGLE